MTGYRDPAKREVSDAQRYRKRLREVESQRTVIEQLASEQRRELIASRVAAWLRDPDDFWLNDSDVNVVDDRGRIDDGRLVRRLRDLRARKPHLFRSDAPD